MAIDPKRLGRTVEKYMIDEIKIERPSNPGTFDPVTLEPIIGTPTLVYAGKAFGSPMGDPQETRLGEQVVYRTQYEVALPRGDDDFEVLPNDVVTFTKTSSLALQGRVLYVHSTSPGTFFTHVRVKCFHDEPAVSEK